MARKGGVFINCLSTSEQFKSLLKKPGVHLIDIFTHCWGPCLAIQPALKQLQLDHSSSLEVTLVAVDKISELRRVIFFSILSSDA